ncbi:2,5-diamino-6-ribosylamino-4(3H)-pyrimidinone 5'-phosphate reductase [[Candida] railenensis]|uniref:2,5-diamino-6-ribosylamino-4(3H)-pyrimidinone 5'-phosphate reductase n=1 Tax=[Candida] railenensis TaxID=45579 RepID=A0A9P0QPR6_9ASCO|nr:2,5-diamino-6-ribosylamino-4(3H)-pyrimidinone 5'-phosphate reductase [[Candida] railenensis]
MLSPLPPTLIPFLGPYLPKQPPREGPFVTLTYAQSLDSRIAASPGVQTKISHLETKTMTHYIRSKHDSILVGIGTVLADDPKLNCRYVGNESNSGDFTSSIRPVVLDPHGKWQYSKSSLSQIHQKGEGLAPYILIDEHTQVAQADEDALLAHDGRLIRLPFKGMPRRESWKMILASLYGLGIKSVMIEGGAQVINDLLSESADMIDSLIVTIGPVFLGNQGVEVAPTKGLTLHEVEWWTGTQDSVLCAKPKVREP